MPASLVNVLYNDYVKPNKHILLVVLMIIIFGVAGIYAFKWFAKPLLSEGAQNMDGTNVANYNDRREVEIYFFFADWCPHCTKAKPQWAAFKSAHDSSNGTGKEVNGYKIKCVDVDCTDGSSSLIQKYKVNGYPTCIMMKDGNQIAFDSKITTDNLMQFVNSVL